MPNLTTTPALTLDVVTAALNKAADDIADTADLGPFGTRDALNLLVNAALYYLATPGADLGQVIEANYAQPPATVIGWITDGA